MIMGPVVGEHHLAGGEIRPDPGKNGAAKVGDGSQIIGDNSIRVMQRHGADLPGDELQGRGKFRR